MMLSSPCRQSMVLGTRIALTCFKNSESSSSLQMTTGAAFLAVICANADSTLAKSESRVMTIMTGMFSSISARGPCLSSPARIPTRQRQQTGDKPRQ
jgi:hypothetical protein